MRLDDLQAGYAFGKIDRSIIMSPQKTNARVVLPVTTLGEVLHGHNVDFILYANNFEETDADHPIIERFDSAGGRASGFPGRRRDVEGHDPGDRPNAPLFREPVRRAAVPRAA